MKLPHVLGVLAAAITIVLVPAAAQAGVNVHTDPTGDVRKFTDDSADSDPGTPDPTQANGDIKSIRVTHGPGKVKVRINFRSLAPGGFAAVQELRIQTPNKSRYVEVVSSKGSWYGQHSLVNGSFDEVSCSGLTHKIDYTYERVDVVIPRSCLGNPRWVRVGAAEVRIDGASNVFVDDARRTGVGSNIVLGPQVYKTAPPRAATDS